MISLATGASPFEALNSPSKTHAVMMNGFFGDNESQPLV
jgi:hypothetical protein